MCASICALFQLLRTVGEIVVPTYEYECTSCGHHFEVKQGFSDEPLSLCPQCRGFVRRRIHATPVIFKGSGFYATDHRRSSAGTDRNNGGAEASEAKPTSEILAEPEKKTDTKTEASSTDTKS